MEIEEIKTSAKFLGKLIGTGASGVIIFVMVTYGDFKVLQENVNNINASLQIVTDEVQGVAGTETGLKINVNKIQTQLESTNEKIASTQSSIISNRELLNKVDKDMQILMDHRAKARIDKLESNIKLEQKANTKLQEHISDLRLQIIDLKDNNSEAQSQIKLLQKLQINLKIQEAKRADVIQQYSLLKPKLTSLQKDMDTTLASPSDKKARKLLKRNWARTRQEIQEILQMIEELEALSS